MKKTILTGGTGFIGANLAHRLLRDGHEVHLLVRPGYTLWRIRRIQHKITLHEVDLLASKVLYRIIDSIQPDWIFHLATYGAYSTQTNLQKMLATNIVGTVNLVEACLKTGFEAFVNTGSSSEYGFKDHPPSEKDWLEPNSYYAVTKASTTLFCRYIAQRYKVQMPTLRLYSVYGPYEEPTRLIPTLIVRGLYGELPPLVKPDIARDYVYVSDVLDAYLLAATHADQEPGAIYNAGTGIQTSLLEVVNIARRILNITSEPQWGSMPDREWDTTVWVANNQSIQETLGWQPNYSFEHGFRLTAEWMRGDTEIRNFYQSKQKAQT